MSHPHLSATHTMILRLGAALVVAAGCVPAQDAVAHRLGASDTDAVAYDGSGGGGATADGGPGKICGDLLVVLDRSGSMRKCTIDGKTKEEIAKQALGAMIDGSPTTPMGLWVFPGNVDVAEPTCGAGAAGQSCKPGIEAVPLAADGSSKIKVYLESYPPSCGGTPTGSTMQLVKDYDGWTPEVPNHFVLLLTDGVPTCDDGQECSGYDGCPECKVPDKAFDAIRDLAAKGIHTFVVGFDSKAAECGPATVQTCPGTNLPKGPVNINDETLNRMAELGGEAVNENGRKYFYASDPISLSAVLSRVGETIKGTIETCSHGGSGGAGGGGGEGGAGPDAGKDGTGGGGGGGTRPPPDKLGCGYVADGVTGDGPALGFAAFVLPGVALARRHRRAKRETQAQRRLIS